MIPDVLELEFFLRILLAGICGVLIGFERSKRLKEAGVRTHFMVACGAALIMIVSKYGFVDTIDPAGGFLFGTRGADSARIAAQVVSGVSFLGAGVIFKTGVSVKGLTTAAGIWTTSAVGLALGSGLYWIGVVATVLIMLAQLIMHWLPFGNDAFTIQEIKVRFRYSKEFQAYIYQILCDRGGVICNCSMEKHGDTEVTYRITIRIKHPIMAEEFQMLMENHDQISAFSI